MSALSCSDKPTRHYGIVLIITSRALFTVDDVEAGAADTVEADALEVVDYFLAFVTGFDVFDAVEVSVDILRRARLGLPAYFTDGSHIGEEAGCSSSSGLQPARGS